MKPVTAFTRIIIAATIAWFCAVPSLADPALPAQQSACELQANRFKAQHPHTDPFDYMSFGFFYFDGTAPPKAPSTYRDPETGVTFYVETDGRHITAIQTNGKLLWVRNPFVETNMCPLRSAHPYIAWVGPPGFVRDYVGPFDPAADMKANMSIVKELDSEILRGRKIEHPRGNDRFIGLSFNSSQYGYINIRNGDFYGMGNN